MVYFLGGKGEGVLIVTFSNLNTSTKTCLFQIFRGEADLIR